MIELHDDRESSWVSASAVSVGFTARKFGAIKVRGTFGGAKGALRLTEAGSARVTGSVAVAGLGTGNRRRDAHLLGPDFLDAARHPDMTLELFPFALDVPAADAVLHLRGRHVPLALRLAVEREGERVRLRAEGSLDRHAAGIVPPGSWDRLVAREVHLHLDAAFLLRAVPGKRAAA